MPGQKIYCQGDLGAEMYFLDKGKVIITVKKYGCEKLSYTKFKKGEYFGEVFYLSSRNFIFEDGHALLFQTSRNSGGSR